MKRIFLVVQSLSVYNIRQRYARPLSNIPLIVFFSGSCVILQGTQIQHSIKGSGSEMVTIGIPCVLLVLTLLLSRFNVFTNAATLVTSISNNKNSIGSKNSL